MLRWNLANELIQRGEFFKNLAGVIVTRNGKIVWKHRPKRPFYEFMLTTNLYQNPFFPTLHQNINKPKSRAFGLSMDLLFYLQVRYLSAFFSFLGQDVIKPGSNSAVRACDLSQKHRLAPFHTSERSKANILQLLFPILLGFEKRHLNIIELGSCVCMCIAL